MHGARVCLTVRYAGIRPDEVALRITCGDVTLYDAAEPADGMTARDCELYELPAEDGAFHHWARCTDHGIREGRPELTLDTPGRSARVFRSGGELDVRLDVEPRSTARRGRNLQWQSAPPPILTTLRLAPVVASVTGYGALSEGDRCQLRIDPPDEPNEAARFNCRIRLRCGRRWLYGAGTSGWNLCRVDADGAPTDAHDRADDDGDPMLDLSLMTGTIAIGETRGDRSRRLTLTFTPTE